MPELAYLGPQGTYTDRAARALAVEGADLNPYGALEDVLAAAASGAIAVAALENTRFGPIEGTARALADPGGLYADARHIIPVSFELLRRPDDAAELAHIVGHPAALGQIEDWIARKRVTVEEASSSVLAVEQVAKGAAPGWGAVSPPGNAEAHGMICVETGLEGEERLLTSFVRLHGAPPREASGDAALISAEAAPPWARLLWRAGEGPSLYLKALPERVDWAQAEAGLAGGERLKGLIIVDGAVGAEHV